MVDKVGKYEFLAEPFHCDLTKHLFMGHLGNHLLNAADFHSSERGFGMAYLNTFHKTWVLSRLAIEMESMPVQYEKFRVETWVESAIRYFTNRNFRITDSDNRVYGYGRSIWAMIDTDTRRPQNILDIDNGRNEDYVEPGRECPISDVSRVQITNDAKLVSSVSTHYSDVDVNGHINSVKYIEHILDTFPISRYKTHRIKRFDIAYVSESYFGDILDIYRDDVSENESLIRVVRRPAVPSDRLIEACRCRLVFEVI